MVPKDSEGAFGTESATGEARFGSELDWEKPWRGQASLSFPRSLGFWLTQAGALPTTSTTTMGLLGFGPPVVVDFCSSAASSALRSRNARCYREPETAFGSESATSGGSFWIRTRELSLFYHCSIGIQKERLGAKVRQGKARLGMTIFSPILAQNGHVFMLQHAMPHKNKPRRWVCGV